MLQLPQLGANCTPTTYRLDFRDSQAPCAGRDSPIHVRQQKNSMRVISLAAGGGEKFRLAVKKRLFGVPGTICQGPVLPAGQLRGFQLASGEKTQRAIILFPDSWRSLPRRLPQTLALVW